MSPSTPVTVSRELIQALFAADLIRLCEPCTKADGLCEPCLAREGPKFAQSSLWFRLMADAPRLGCPRCGAAMKVEHPTDGSAWMTCTGYPELCSHQVRLETAEERAARETYEAKAERRAMALARATAAAGGRFVRNRVPVKRVA